MSIDMLKDKVISTAITWARSSHPEPEAAAALYGAVEDYLVAADIPGAFSIPPLPPLPPALPAKLPPVQSLSLPSMVVVKGQVTAGFGKADHVTPWASLSLPYPLAAGPEPDILEAVLLAEFPWLGDAIRHLCNDLRLRRSAGQAWAKWRPMLMVGPPGSGKSRLARRIAQLVGAGMGEVTAAGSNDNLLLKGASRGWRDSGPALPLHIIRQAGFANPTMLVDEIDKTRPDGRNGDIRHTLLMMLEPLTAKAWPDEYLMTACDLSGVNWLLCANDVSGLPSPFLSRLRVVEAPMPKPEHFPAVLSCLRRDLAIDLGVRIEDLPLLAPRAEAALYASFKRGMSLRRVRVALESAILAAGGIGEATMWH